MFAIIKTGGKQYKVSTGDTLTIEKIDPTKKEVTFEEVLLIGGEKLKLGKPTVTGAVVKAVVLDQFRGEKIRVFKYRAKSHWQRTKGHRQDLTKVLIKDIVSGTVEKKSIPAPQEGLKA